MKSIQPDQLPLAKRDPQLAPKAMKKKKKEAKKGGQTKVVGAGLYGFEDWTNPTASELGEEEDMSSLTAKFATRMCKRAVSSQGETTLGSKVLGGKSLKWFNLDEEA